MTPPLLASGSHCSNVRTLCELGVVDPPSPQNSNGPCQLLEVPFETHVFIDLTMPVSSSNSKETFSCFIS